MDFEVRFYKERHKFSAAHFTLFGNGEVERLHGHNYAVTVALTGRSLQHGLVFPFQKVKAEIGRLCDAWDERVLLPARSEWVDIQLAGAQCEVKLKTPLCSKFYSIPREDVVLLECDNVSSENLAMLFAGFLKHHLEPILAEAPRTAVTISESPGQSVTYRTDS